MAAHSAYRRFRYHPSFDVGGLAVGRTYRVTASALALRSGPSTTAPLIEWMPANTLVTARSAEGIDGFQQVTNITTGHDGWAFEQYLGDIGPAQPGPALPAGTYYVAAGPPSNAVNVRPTPSLAIPATVGLPDGTAVHVTGVNLNGFAQTDSPKAGWIATQYLSATPGGGAFTGANVPTAAPGLPPQLFPSLPANEPTPPPSTEPSPGTDFEVDERGNILPGTSAKAKAATMGTVLLVLAIGIGFVVARDKKKRKAA